MVLDLASATKGHLDARFVVPADVSINLVNKLGHGEGPPITRIEELSLQASEEAFTCGIVLRARLAFRDIGRTSFAASIRSSQPGQR